MFITKIYPCGITPRYLQFPREKLCPIYEDITRKMKINKNPTKYVIKIEFNS